MMRPPLNVAPEHATLALQMLADAGKALRGAALEARDGYYFTASDSIDVAIATAEEAKALLTPKPVPAAEVKVAA